MRTLWRKLLLLISVGSLAACFPAWTPNQVSEEPSPLPVPLYAAPLPSPAQGLSLEEWVEQRMRQIRWVRAPSEEELRVLRESLAREARERDRNRDGILEESERE